MILEIFFRYGEPTVKGYYQKIAQAFVKLRSSGISTGNYNPVILFDGANGVGALAMAKFLDHMEGSLNTTIFNKGEGVLNLMCGADYVKVRQSYHQSCAFCFLHPLELEGHLLSVPVQSVVTGL